MNDESSPDRKTTTKPIHKNITRYSPAMPSFQDKIVVCTGGGSGIGKALCLAFARAGASVVVADLKGAETVREKLHDPEKHMSAVVDVTDANAVGRLVRQVKRRYHRIDVYCSNAGIMVPSDPNDDSCVKHSLADWNKIFQVNVLSHGEFTSCYVVLVGRRSHSLCFLLPF